MRCGDHITEIRAHGDLRVGGCSACGEVRFRDVTGGSDPWNAIGALFGDYQLVGPVDTIRAPASEVLAYRPSQPADQAALKVTPPHQWFKANEHLWMCHDGQLLLLAHQWPSVSRLIGA